MWCNRNFDVRTMAVGVVCVWVIGSANGLGAQGLIKPGAYHSEGMTLSHRVGVGNLMGSTSSHGTTLTGISLPFSESMLDLGLDYGLVGYSVGAKFPMPKLRSQFIPAVGVEIGAPGEFFRATSDSGEPEDDSWAYIANRIELSAEWRAFPFGHAEDKKYDWEKPWVGLGANLGYRRAFLPDANDDSAYWNPLHYGTFLKIGTGFIALFAEVGLSPLFGKELRDNDDELEGTESFDGISSYRTLRYGLVLEF